MFLIASQLLQELPVREAQKVELGKHTLYELPRRTSSSGYQSGKMSATT
jgi:hypothetical protein